MISGLCREIEEATARFVVELTGVDGRGWTTRPDPDQWRLSEILELPYLFHRGAEPPEVARPTGTWTDLDDGVEQLRTAGTSVWRPRSPMRSSSCRCPTARRAGGAAPTDHLREPAGP